MNNVSKNSWAYWYDLMNTGKRGDYQFYRKHITREDLALEIACGTGRIYLDMLEDGYNVHGLDLSKSMLRKLQQNAERRDITTNKLFEKDVCSMNLDYDYDFIYYPFNSIAHINGGVENQLNTFDNIQDHLEKDGKFAFDIYVMDFDSITNYGELKSKKFDHEGVRYKLEKWSELLSRTKQTFRSYNRIINLDENKIEWQTDHKLSLYPKQQIELILQNVGFTDIKFFDGFTEEPLHNESDRMSIVAEK